MSKHGTIFQIEFKLEIRYAIAPWILKLLPGWELTSFSHPDAATAAFDTGFVPDILLMHAHFPIANGEKPAEYRRAANFCETYISKYGGRPSAVFVVRSVGTERTLQEFGFPDGVNHCDIGRESPEAIVLQIKQSIPEIPV